MRSLPIFRTLPAAVAGISIGGVAICYLLPVYGIQWVLDLCNGIVEEGSIPEDWKSSANLQRQRRPYGVWIVLRDQIAGTCYESGRKDFSVQNSAAD